MKRALFTVFCFFFFLMSSCRPNVGVTSTSTDGTNLDPKMEAQRYVDMIVDKDTLLMSKSVASDDSAISCFSTISSVDASGNQVSFASLDQTAKGVFISKWKEETQKLIAQGLERDYSALQYMRIQNDSMQETLAKATRRSIISTTDFYQEYQDNLKENIAHYDFPIPDRSSRSLSDNRISAIKSNYSPGLVMVLI